MGDTNIKNNVDTNLTTLKIVIGSEYSDNMLIGESDESQKYIPLKIVKSKRSKLNASLSVPSHIHEYSLCIEYAKKWFMDKFPKDYFKSIYIDGEHALSEYRKYTREQFIKRDKPSLAIVAQEDYSFDNENLDLVMNNVDMFVGRSNAIEPFFRDRKKELFLKMLMKVILINFTFKIRVNTKAKQLDLYRYLITSFSAGTTRGYYMDMDYHIPRTLMVQLAKDSGFTVINDEIQDSISFVSYLNSNSVLPFLYKLRCETGNNEFFIRVPNLYIHHRIAEDLDIDEGERQGQINSNYSVELHCAIRFPCPFFYAYYTEHIQNNIVLVNDDGTETSYASNFSFMPRTNSKGWFQYITTEYEENDLTKPLTIDFNSLFTNTIEGNKSEDSDILKLIKYTQAMKINPSIFMEIKIFNDRKEQAYTLDWDTLILTSKSLMVSPKSYIAIYIDNKYFNEQLINMKEYKKGRMSLDGTQGHNPSY